MQGAIYYTDFNCSPEIHSVCLEHIRKNFKGEIVSVSLNKPVDLGTNIVLNRERSNTTMVTQIVTALEALKTENVFFLEHDVLYHPSHFDFTPPKDNIFYYNLNTWRWDFPKDRLINYLELTSLSNLCANRQWTLDHYRKRIKRILDSGWDKEDGIGKLQPNWVRALGYEPGTKRRRIGGFSDDVSERWRSAFPNVDIRHGMNLTRPKTTLNDFKHLPHDWKERTISQIEGWELKTLFNL